MLRSGIGAMERIDLTLKLHTKKFLCRMLCAAMAVGFMVMGAAAVSAPCESAVATGSYRHPGTGSIEDSGGEGSEALGQSMVSSVVSPEALLETAADGKLYLSLRFNLMSNISKTTLAVQKSGDSAWTPAVYDITAEGEDTKDLRLEIPAKDAVIRAECFVDAMGRAVIFYVTVDDFSAGNAGGFAQLDAAQSPKPTSGSSNTVEKNDNVVGLVTGGTGKQTQVPADPQNTRSDENVQQITVTGKVWLMFFVLVFCAQLLACLAFWGIRTWVLSRKAPQVSRSLPEEPDEEPDFSEELWEEDWEDAAHEVR